MTETPVGEPQGGPFADIDPFLKRKDLDSLTDESWISPLHTLGKGSTQAAPGNHGHAIETLDGYSDLITAIDNAGETDHGALSGLEDDDHPQYRRFDTPTSQTSGPWGPIQTYEPVSDVIPSFTVFSQTIHHDSINLGTTFMFVNGYLQIRDLTLYSLDSISIYATCYGRWHDNLPVEWLGDPTSIMTGRFTLTKPSDYGYASIQTSRMFHNRPGMRGSFGLQAGLGAALDGGAAAYVGYPRITLIEFPYGTTLNDNPVWGIP